jgi:transcriptional regulator GlxA family with amidase domain
MYPKISVRASVLYIDDGDILTAGGGAAGMDLGLHLIRTSYGAVVANRLARSIVVPPHRPGGQSQYIESPVPELDQDDPVGETMSWALGQLDQILPIDVLARRARMSRRNFDRRFRELTGTAPATWLTHQRVLRAQRLLESTRLSVEEVARSCGFSSAAALRPHFRPHTATPSARCPEAVLKSSLVGEIPGSAATRMPTCSGAASPQSRAHVFDARRKP